MKSMMFPRVAGRRRQGCTRVLSGPRLPACLWKSGKENIYFFTGQFPSMDRRGPGVVQALPRPCLPACHGNIWTENIYFLTRRFPCGGQVWPGACLGAAHAWPMCGPCVAHAPAELSLSKGRKEFHASWISFVLDRPEFFPSFA